MFSVKHISASIPVMEIILWLPDTYPALVWPASIVGWLGWLVFLGLIIGLAQSWRQIQLPWGGRNWGIFAGLVVSIILSTLAFGLLLPVGTALSQPNVPLGPRGPALMFLSALPLMLAGGILGPVAAALLGFLAGVLRFVWDTHSIYTSLELALLGILFSIAVRQRYRTHVFSLLREPLIATFVLALIYAPIFIIDSFLVSSGTMEDRLIYALAGVTYSVFARGGELLLAGLFAQVLAVAFPAPWGRRLPLQPSPIERSLEARFLFGTGALIIILLLALLVGDWFVAGTAARDMLHNRLKGTAELASQSVPFFLETGQNLSIQISQDPGLQILSGDELNGVLSQQIRSIPYFNQLIVFDNAKRLLGNYPSLAASRLNLSPEENIGLDLAFSGILSQTYSIPPSQPGQPARVSFIIAIIDPSTAQPGRVLVARTDLANNPFAQPLIASLKSMSESDLGGDGILLDENRRILYPPAQVMSQYTGQQKTEAAFFDDTASKGTRNLVYYLPVTGRSWAVVLTVPAQKAQQIALKIAAPLSGMIIFLALVALIALRVGLSVITTSLQTLANEAVRIAQGQLDHELTIEGVDEVGQLRRAFEQMRVSLQSRLEELNRFLLVSQGVASSLDMQDAVQPVMEAVLATGASAVRVVMPPFGEDAEQGQTAIYALGPCKEHYAYLDEQVMALAHQQERVVLTNVPRSRGLELNPGKTNPASLLAIPLRHENKNYGVLWAGYDQARLFSETDVRFLTTLAGQAALAASNNRLFRSAEVGRQRLAAILASTPDPVLVTDQFNRLLLANPAAWQMLGVAIGTGEGQPIEKVVSQKPLLDILQVTSPDELSAEVTLPSGQVYLATASPVVADGRPVGRVCILRDVTHFKELDTMKTEFVSTVSHDLRSPLTLMRGYATMLEMVGALNEQQQGYVKKIIFGVENMARLVNNLLDLGRVEAGVGLQLETIPLYDLLERVTTPLQMQAANKNIELTVDTPKNTMPLIEADPALFQQAMYNLIENAIKYTPQGGRVDVRLKIVGDGMLFEVQDSGIGIAPIDQPRLFEKFYRGGQREAREQKGSGLGLAIVKSITERHGGKVWLESQLGKGSTFFLQVPLHQPKESSG
jgi:signal transduction histidine kinase/HAMP domain-containing protein